MLGIVKDHALAQRGILQYEQTLENSNNQGRGRGKRIKLTFKGVNGMPKEKGAKAIVAVDGENLEFENTLVFESVPGGVEYLFDHKQYFKDFKIEKE